VPEPDAATQDASKPSESSKPQPASTGGAVAGTANTVDVASSASTPALNTAEASTNMAQSMDKQPDAASAATLEGNKSDAEGVASTAAAPADFSSFLSANKEQSPFAVKAGGETSAFGGGSNALSFGSTTGGFGSLGQLPFACTLWYRHC